MTGDRGVADESSNATATHLLRGPDNRLPWAVTVFGNGSNSLESMQVGFETQTASTTEVRVSAIGTYIEYVPLETGTGTLAGAGTRTVDGAARFDPFRPHPSIVPLVASVPR